MKDFFKIFGPVAVIIVLAWYGWWRYTYGQVPNMEARGQLGDLFGGINALFSGLALAGVVTAVVLQSHELQLQRVAMEKHREELELTRSEIKLQREQLELQREELKLSREEFHRMASANEESAKSLSRQLSLQIQASKINALSSMLASAGQRALARTTARGSFDQGSADLIETREVELTHALGSLESSIAKL